MFKIGDLIKPLQDNYTGYAYGYIRSVINNKNKFGQVASYDSCSLCLILDIKECDGNHKEIMFFVDNKILYANSLMFEYV
jgi:hypothetical protein